MSVLSVPSEQLDKPQPEQCLCPSGISRDSRAHVLQAESLASVSHSHMFHVFCFRGVHYRSMNVTVARKSQTPSFITDTCIDTVLELR